MAKERGDRSWERMFEGALPQGILFVGVGILFVALALYFTAKPANGSET